MPLVADGFALTVNFVDTGGNPATRTYNLSSADVATAQTDAADVLAALAGVSAAAIAGYTLGQKFIESALVYPANAEVEKIAQFSAKIIGHPNKSAVFDIPAPLPAIFQSPSGPGYNIVNTAFGPVATYLGLFDGSGPVTVSDGESIVVASVKGKRASKKSSKG